MTLHLRVTPNAGADRIEGAETRVAAVPDKGNANAAALALLTKALVLPKSALTLTAGATSRTKTVTIAGDPDEMAAKLKALL